MLHGGPKSRPAGVRKRRPVQKKNKKRMCKNWKYEFQVKVWNLADLMGTPAGFLLGTNRFLGWPHFWDPLKKRIEQNIINLFGQRVPSDASRKKLSKTDRTVPSQRAS